MSRRPERGDTASPSPLPPHIRPTISRHHSASSVSSNRPYAQQREYVHSNLEAGFAAEAGTPGIARRWAYEQAGQPTPGGPEEEEGDEEEDGGSEADWAAAKERDDASRPAWRRASPRWLYPFVSGATLALGMGLAPRSELYVNLACLAHPPRTPSALNDISVASVTAEKGSWGMYNFHSIYINDLANNLRSDIGFDVGIGNATTPSLPSTQDEISPADKWFYNVQRSIYDYQTKHSHRANVPSSPSWTSGLPIPTQSSPHKHHKERPSGSAPSHNPRPSDKPKGDKEGKKHHDKEDGRPPYREINPRDCKRDPVVLAAAARLVMFMSVAMGILSALTTGYWGQMSDRIGRTKIMALMETGLLINEVCFILIATFPYLAPGGYKALLIGPTIEGLLGGISILTATVNAYVSDTTPDGSRASVFARMGGIFMLGFAFGPVLGSSVIKATGNIMTPFYLNVAVHFIYIMMILLVLPESLSKEARTILKKNAKIASDAQKRQDNLAREWENETPAAGPEVADPFLTATTGSAYGAGESGWSGRGGHRRSKRQKKIVGILSRGFRKSTAFLRPLGVFMPTEKEEGGKDWNMTVTGLALFFMSFMMGVYQVKTQYTIYKFGWSSAQIGPYMSFVGFSRGFVMLVVLPLSMRFAKPYFVPRPTTSPSDPTTSNFSAISQTTATSSESSPLLPPARVKVRRPATLDLWTARLSLAWESTSYFILSIGLPQIPFIIVTAIVTLSSGAGPAANSLALSFLPNSREAGKLFGGAAVLQALGSTLLGPLAFGTLFSYTVGTFTAAVWILAGSIVGLAFALMCFVRIPGEKDVDGVGERGRSKRVKTVRSSSGILRK